MAVWARFRRSVSGLVVVVVTCVACGATDDDGATTSPCGNGTLDPGEDCDEPANMASGACRSDCRWACETGPAGDEACDDHLSCNGKETCNSAHLCAPGTPLPDGTTCGPNMSCRAGACVPTGVVCGDAIVVSPPEECDLGPKNGPNAGCELTCRFSCVSTDDTRSCQPLDPCNGAGACDDATHVCGPATPLANGTPCGSGKKCQSGTCTDKYCGNGQVDPGEECDEGASIPANGCEATCKHTCFSMDPTRNCAPTDPCKGASTCDDVTHTCSPRTPLADGTPCGSGRACKAGSCVSLTCGNSTLEAGEECDPPNGTTCDLNCKKVVCDLTGTWASYTMVNVTWSGSLVLASGSGQVKQWSRVTTTQTGTTASNVLLPCKIEIPDWSGSALAGSELYGLSFPASLFDAQPPYLPATTVTATLGSPPAPGASYATPAFAGLLGLMMTLPETDPWPQTVTSVDHDVDNNPGVTAPVKTGGSYKLLPLDFGKSARGDVLYLAIRQVTSISATLDTCNQLSGTANVSKVDSHVLGCHVAGSGSPGTSCNATQTTFLDNNRVKYVIGTASFLSKRITNGADCAAVRAALP